MLLSITMILIQININIYHLLTQIIVILHNLLLLLLLFLFCGVLSSHPGT